MKFSIIKTFLESVQFYKNNFKAFWKQFWAPMALILAHMLAFPSMNTAVQQKTTSFLAFFLFCIFGYIPSWLVTRSMIPFMKGAPLSSFWGRPFDKKDWQYFLRNIVFTLVIGVSVVPLIALIVACAIFLGSHAAQYGISIDSIQIFIYGAGAISMIAFVMILVRLVFYPFSVYSDHPLTLKTSWKLLDKNGFKVGFGLLFSMAILTGLTSILGHFYPKLLYPLTILNLFLWPIWYIFFTSVFLTLSGGKDIFFTGK
jgi:hypothetical protein